MMEEPRMIIEMEKKAAEQWHATFPVTTRMGNLPMMGTLVEVGGVTSATIPRNTVTERRLVVCRVIFSPHSDGMA